MAMSVGRYARHTSRRRAAEAAAGATIWKASKTLLRKRIAPGFSELVDAAGGIQANAAELLRSSRWSGQPIDDDRLDALGTEFRTQQRVLAQRHRNHQRLPFPADWAIESETAFLLYALTRLLQPQHVLELGVANGQSSFFVLRALQRNGGGQLHSFDIAQGVGGAVDDAERDSWDLVILDRHNPNRELSRRLRDLPAAGLCFHDADHGYLAQIEEFSQLWEKLATDGVLISDDVDASYALIDFSKTIGRQPSLLVDKRKVVGVLACPGPRRLT